MCTVWLSGIRWPIGRGCLHCTRIVSTPQRGQRDHFPDFGARESSRDDSISRRSRLRIRISSSTCRDSRTVRTYIIEDAIVWSRLFKRNQQLEQQLEDRAGGRDEELFAPLKALRRRQHMTGVSVS